MPLRALHRVETAAAETVAVLTRDLAAQGQLLNISAGGCRVRLAPPLALAFGGDTPIEISLETPQGPMRCPAELRGLHVRSRGVELRLRFRALSVEQRRALLSYLGGLVTHAASGSAQAGRVARGQQRQSGDVVVSNRPVAVVGSGAGGAGRRLPVE